MSPPTERFKKLSLESMPPTTRLQSRLQHAEVEVEVEDSSSSSSSSDPGSEPDFDIDEDEDLMVSPSRLKYSLDLLDDETRDNVVRAAEVPSQFVLRGCQAGEQRCFFLVTEPVEYTVRTGSEASGYGVPSCTCESDDPPCRHILWLFDRIAGQVLGARATPYTLTRHGYPAELGGNPYDAIAGFHLDTLADGLHCDVVGQSPDPNPRRVRETRELLASLNDVPADEYRPDLFGDNSNNSPRKGKRAVVRGDLEQTVFRMLLRNDDFFHYFLSSASLRPGERNEVRFRGLQLRADAALAGLQQYADGDPSLQAIPKPKDVAWCAAHLESVARQVRAVIHTTDRPLEAPELRAAARTAVHVLERVVSDFDRDAGPASLPAEERNLYRRLIGGARDDDSDDFVIDVLDSIPPEVLGPWIDDLAAVERGIAEKGAPAAYLARLRSLLGHLREHSGGATATVAGSKRGSGGQFQAQDRRAKRAR
ncbi:hypothetical protein F4820DRAFT_420034 [Hypoxylon rubiginosum]|uniref:Uncharacterized protein n=1 Tax=Hypoxylon rubiginosum TaxID=110542 RepID=A0ACB9Z1F5_9PEZI|nr:hypothetical protein F4820DRAFT_420034 [Hypoxylon rubiginosum]